MTPVMAISKACFQSAFSSMQTQKVGINEVFSE